MKTILVDAVNTSIIQKENGGYMKFDPLFELLETYPNEKIIVTNADDDQIIEFALDDVPYPVFSMKHNPDKPNPIFFETLLKQYELKPDDVVYFEHNPDAVTSAQSIGINAYNYNKDTRDLATLKEFLDKNL